MRDKGATHEVLIKGVPFRNIYIFTHFYRLPSPQELYEHILTYLLINKCFFFIQINIARQKRLKYK